MASTQAIVKRTAVFVRELRDGKVVYIRQPYDEVEYDRAGPQDVAGPNKTYYQPYSGKARARGTGSVGSYTTTSAEEIYDELKVLDRPDAGAPSRSR